MGRKKKYNSPEEFMDAMYARSKKYLQDHQEIRLFNSAKINAAKKELEFEITKEDVKSLLDETIFCRYLGCKITNITGKGRVTTNASLDRIDSTKGYTKDNIQIISDLANRMKQDATLTQLVSFAEGVLAEHPNVVVIRQVA